MTGGPVRESVRYRACNRKARSAALVALKAPGSRCAPLAQAVRSQKAGRARAMRIHDEDSPSLRRNSAKEPK